MRGTAPTLLLAAARRCRARSSRCRRRCASSSRRCCLSCRRCSGSRDGNSPAGCSASPARAVGAVGVAWMADARIVGIASGTLTASSVSGLASSSATVFVDVGDVAAGGSANVLGVATVAYASDAGAVVTVAELVTIGVLRFSEVIAAPASARVTTRPEPPRPRIVAGDLAAGLSAIATRGGTGVGLTLERAALVVGRKGIARRRSSSLLKIVSTSCRRSASSEEAGLVPELERLERFIVRDHDPCCRCCNPPTSRRLATGLVPRSGCTDPPR